VNYYNEIDPYCVQWLNNLILCGLIPDGHVDDRSIRDVQPSDLKGYRQCHFFAGIAGWPLALAMAEWPEDREVWTGSCPCQPFSSAGARKDFDDDRHLWPDFLYLINLCRPATVFGEQVANAVDWISVVRSDLEALGYPFRAMPIEAACAGARQFRDRFWFGAGAHGERQYVRPFDAEMATSSPIRASVNLPRRTIGKGLSAEAASALRQTASNSIGRTNGFEHWRHEPGVGRVVDGVPARVAKVRAFGNAIVPQVAAEFIRAAS
jgi:DNA (cytosine-5)-methyltransferase 1